MAMRILSSIFLGLVYAILIAVPAKADPGAIFDKQNRAFFSALDGYNLVLGTEDDDDVIIRQDGTDTLTIDGTTYKTTLGGDLTFSNYGGVQKPSYVPTMAATPAAGTNDCKPNVINAVPTAAANTACLSEATPSVGDEYVVYNTNGTNATRFKPGGASAINGATAGKYVEIAAGEAIKCLVVSASQLRCNSLTTTAMATPA